MLTPLLLADESCPPPPAAETLNPLELDGTLLPGLIQAVNAHLAILAENIDLVRNSLPEEAGRATARINQSARDVRGEINRLQATRALAECEGVQAAGPAMSLPELTGLVAEELRAAGWEVQCADANADQRAACVDVRWLRHAVRALLRTSGAGPGLAVFHLPGGDTANRPQEFSVRLLHERASGGALSAAALDEMSAARHVLAVMGGSLDARKSDTVMQFTLSLPLVAKAA